MRDVRFLDGTTGVVVVATAVHGTARTVVILPAGTVVRVHPVRVRP